MAERGFGIHFGLYETDPSFCKVFDIEGRRSHDEAGNFTSRNELRTQNEVDAEISLDILCRLRQELRVPDAGNGMGETVFLRQDAGNDIHFIQIRHRDQ